MKKYLYLIPVAALAMTACTNESDEFVGSQESREISFSLVNQMSTRAAADTYQYAIDGTTFPTDLNMYVAAYQVEPTKANYFAGTQFIYNNAGGASASSAKWGGATARFWPLSPAYINFLAYANVTGTAIFNATNYASAATINQSDNSSAQTDLMYAIGNGEVTQSGSTLTFPASVPMTFIHAQAWMDFYVKANSATEEAITINSITLNGAKYSGKFIVTHDNYNARTSQSVSGAWSNTSSQKNVAVPGWSSTALTTSLVHVGKGLLIVPDDDNATADWTSFTINYTYDSKTYDYTYVPATAADANAAQNKHYVFNITFKLHEIFVDATIADWSDAAAQNITVKE